MELNSSTPVEDHNNNSNPQSQSSNEGWGPALKRFYVLLPQLAVAVGVLLRLKNYFGSGSLWVDESWVAIEVTSSSFRDILSGNYIFQNSPHPSMLFCLLLKTATLVFGNNELALRLVPLLFGLLSIFLFDRLAKRYLGELAYPLAVWLFAISEPVLYFATEVKRYSTSVFVAVLIWYLADRFLQKPFTARRALAMSLMVSVLLWLSNVSIFITLGILATLFFKLCQERRWRELLNWFGAMLVLAGSFYWLYQFSLRDVIDNPEIEMYWEHALWNGKPFTVESWRMLVHAFWNSFTNPVGLWPPALILALMAAGIWNFLRRDRWAALSFVLPILGTALAAHLGKYPFWERVIIFLVPAYFLFIASGAEFVAVQLFKNNRALIATLLLIIFFKPVNDSILGRGPSRPKPDNRTAIEYFSRNYRLGDKIYLNTNKRYAFWYYAGSLGFGKRLPQQLGVADDGTPLGGVRTGVFSQNYTELGKQKVIGMVYEYHLYDQDGYFQDSLFRRGDEVVPLSVDGNYNCTLGGRAWVLLPGADSPSDASANRIIQSYFDRCGRQQVKLELPGTLLYLYEMG